MDRNSCATAFGHTGVSAMLINYLFDDTDSFLFEEVNTDYVRDFKFPVAEMIQSFLSRCRPPRPLSSAGDDRDRSSVWWQGPLRGPTTAWTSLIRMMTSQRPMPQTPPGTQRERVKRIPSSHAKAGGTGALDAFAQWTTQQLHNQKELINPDEAVACGAAVQAEHHRAKRHLNTQRKRAKRGLSSSMQHRHAQCA